LDQLGIELLGIGLRCLLGISRQDGSCCVASHPKRAHFEAAPMIHLPENRFRFNLTRGQLNALRDHLLIGGEVLDDGVESDPGSISYDLSRQEVEDLVESIAAAINHATDPNVESMLERIYERLEKLFRR
jgi:hypothetical protein